jgi:hypothetical protein
MINHEKGKDKRQVIVGTTSQKMLLLNSGAILFVPQGNSEHKTEGINTPSSTVHSVWVTTERLKRKRRSLGCHPCNHTFLTSESHTSVMDIRKVKIKS